MSWQMPIPGQWNPGAIAQTPAMMTPDMQAGNYTQEQWALMQQQNWQQWTQWQQQYAQWQSQYGDKYAQQMQAIQQIGGMPPLPPTNAPPPAPPPPDKPPPPPHENDQPLYANSQGQPVPVPAPTSMQTRTLAAIPTSAASQPLYPAAPNSYENNIGNNQQWSYESESHSQPPKSEHQQPPPPPPSQPLAQVNADALKKLAEEERLFDIQFKKWEEEIEKWKSENVNHPDKQAYNEYEQKFEACRAQLLERRKQMNLRRAKLLGTPPQVSSVTINKPPVLPMNIPMTQAPSTTNQHQGNLNKSNHQQQNYYNDSPQYLNQNAAQNQSTYGRANNQNAETQDRYGSYQEMSNEDTCNSNDSPSFLPSSASSKGIPGLDLVSEADKTHTSQQDVIDITEDEKGQKGPDYNTISKGINNILGDAKIMNILSMVIGKSEPTNAQALQGQGNQNNSENSQWGDNTNYQAFRNQQQQFVNQQNRGPNNMNHPMQNNQRPGHPMQRNQGQGYPMQQNQGPMQWNQRPGHPNQQNQGPRHPIQHNQGPGQPNQQNQGPGQPNQQNQGVGQPHQGPNRQMQQGFSQQGPPRNMFNNRQSGQEQQDQYYNDGNGAYEQDYQNHGHTISEAQRPGRPNRPLIPNLPGLQQINEFPNTPNNRPYQRENVASVPVAPPPKPKWVEEPLFAPSIIVEYEHKPLRLKARDFLEPVHLFDYNHISKDDEYKSKDSDNFGKEFEDELFTKRGSRRDDDIFNRRSRQSLDRHGREREPPSRDYERRFREDLRDDWKSRAPPRDSFDERRRPDERYDDKRSDDRYDDRRRDDRDRYSRRDSDRDRDREREKERDDRYRRDDSRNRGRESESRKRGTSTEDDNVEAKKAKGKITVSDAKHIVMIDDLIEQPGRDMRPEKLVIILRGPPGSGKSYLAKLIRDREAEYGNAARIMSIDDYFMQEIEVEEKDPATGKIVKKPSIKYEYDEKLEETYLNSLKRAFKRSLTDGYFPFLIYDAVNDQLKSYADVWNFARQNGFQVYICTMEMDAQTCYKRNIHNRTLEDIEVICARFFQTPSHHIQLDATTLLQNAAITEVHMEDADDDVIMEDQEPEVESSFTSKWEKMDDANQLARLDGTSKPLRSSQLSMEDYLQLDEWQPSKAKPGKKTVRWADIEERREQEKMRAIGFVVGQTDWNRMTDPTMGSSALTQTKYIERVRRK